MRVPRLLPVAFLAAVLAAASAQSSGRSSTLDLLLKRGDATVFAGVPPLPASCPETVTLRRGAADFVRARDLLDNDENSMRCAGGKWNERGKVSKSDWAPARTEFTVEPCLKGGTLGGLAVEKVVFGIGKGAGESVVMLLEGMVDCEYEGVVGEAVSVATPVTEPAEETTGLTEKAKAKADKEDKEDEEDEEEDEEGLPTQQNDDEVGGEGGDEKSGGSSTAVVVGGVTGGLGVLALLALSVFCCMKRRGAAKLSDGGRDLVDHNAARSGNLGSGSMDSGALPPPPAGFITHPPNSSNDVPLAGAALETAVDAGTLVGGPAPPPPPPPGAEPVLRPSQRTPVNTNMRYPHPVFYDPTTEPVSDARALRAGAPAVGVGVDGILPIHIAFAIDVSDLACSAANAEDGDTRATYAQTVAAIMQGMGPKSLASLVFFSGDVAAVPGALIQARVTDDMAMLASEITGAQPPPEAGTTFASGKACMRAVSLCIGLLRETPEGMDVVRRVLVMSGGGVSDAQMQALRNEANAGKGWKTANCVTVAAFGRHSMPSASVQLGAVALEGRAVQELGQPDSVRLLKKLFAAENPRLVRSIQD